MALPSQRRNLVISPIGPGSVHASWLSQPEERSFDLFLLHYGDQPDYGRAEADHYLSRKGFKWELIDHVVAEHRAVLDQYDYIWCPDGDICADTATVNRLFALMRQYDLQLAQPAIAAGEISYQVLRAKPGVVLRYTPFVEVMCPVFTRQTLLDVQPTFAESRSGWGLDLLWPRYVEPRRMAVLDAAGVEHTGRLFRGENYRNLDKLGVSPGEELARIIAKHGGFNRRLHRRLVRGRIKLPAVWEPGHRPAWGERLLRAFGWRQAYA
ncbi:MAG: DUF707 domain-containing protein [Planctomycetota bacterium]|nr:MAG: DUF707 domain-containing protein [Planctomycetota bacterium]